MALLHIKNSVNIGRGISEKPKRCSSRRLGFTVDDGVAQITVLAQRTGSVRTLGRNIEHLSQANAGQLSIGQKNSL